MLKKCKTSYQKAIKVLMFVLLLTMIRTEASAACSDGIRNNGTGGISIDINAAPYTTFSTYSYGNNAYTSVGCAWYASARVNQLTGKGNTIWSGSSWYNSAYSSCGFSRGTEVRAPAIVCWSGHVAILEKIDGDTAYLSEGGVGSYRNWGTWCRDSNASNGYCVIHAISVSEVKTWCGQRSDYLGCVYLPTAHTHSYSSTVTKQPTCTQTGVRTYRCSCGSSYTETIAATGHKYVNTVVAPTLTEKGYTKHTCSVCNNTYKDAYVDPPKVNADGWYYCDSVPTGIAANQYTIEYNNHYEKIQATSPGTGWKNAATVKDEWQNSGAQYDSEQDLPTSNERVLVNSVYYHFCGPNAGANGNYEQTSKFVHYDGVAAGSVTVTSSGMDGTHPYYLLNWNNGNGTVYCQSGVTCDGAYGSHGKRCKAWYKMNTYQNRVHVVQYKFTKDSGWTSKRDSSAASAKIRFKAIEPEKKSYKVTFMDGEKIIKTEDVLEGKAAIAPACEKAGYVLSWDKAFDNVTSDLIVNAVWTEKKDNGNQETGKDNKNENNTPPSASNTPSGDNKQDNTLPSDNNKPSKDNSTNAGTNTTTANKQNTVKRPKAQVAKISGVTVRTSTDGTAKVIKLPSGKKKITIPTVVKIDDVKYMIVSVGKKAFKGMKKNAVISINTKQPINIEKNAFKGINSKKVVIKVNKKMKNSNLKRFKKILKKAGFKGKVKKVLK